MEQTDGSKTGAERRRYARLPINLEASIAIEGRPRVRCAAKDFCVAGMFIQLDPLELSRVSQQQRARLFFRLESTGPELQLELLVCRVIPAGLGVSFENPPPSTLERLDEYSRAHASTTQESLGEIQRQFSADFAPMLPRMLGVLEPFAGFLIEEFTRQIAEALFLATREAKSNQDARAIIDAQMELRERSDSLRKRVPQTLARAMTILGDPVQAAGSGEAPKAGGGLSLVDKDEFEQFLSVSSVIAELEKAFHEPLSELSSRLSTLARRIIDDRCNPVGPAVICNIYIDALKQSLGGAVVSETIFRTLRRLLEAHLGRLYADLNALLETWHIKPLIEETRQPPTVRKPGKSTKPTKPETAEPPPAVEAATPPASMAGGRRGSGRAPAGAGATEAPAVAGAHSGLPAAPGRASPGTGAGAAAGAGPDGALAQVASEGASGGPSYQGVDRRRVNTTPAYVEGINDGLSVQEPVGTEGGGPGDSADYFPLIDLAALGAEQQGGASSPPQGPTLAWSTSPSLSPMQRALGSARAQLGWRRQLRDEAPPPAPTSGGQYAPAQIATALGELSSAPGAAEVPPLLDATAIGERVSQALRQKGLGEKAIAAEQQEVIEVMVNLLSSLLQDPQLADVAKTNIRRLQGAAHRAAVLDEQFFSNEQHPMRRLINRVAEVRPAVGGDAAVLEERVTALVSAAGQQIEVQPDHFELSFSELESILEQQNQDYEVNVAAVVQATEQQQRMLKERRERSGLPPPSTTSRMPQSEEWERWLRRARALCVGERFLMNAGTPQAFPVSLVWIGEDFNPFAFADRRGQKALTLTLEQVAMNLRRGVLKPLGTEVVPAMERALSGVVERLHEDIAEQAAFDDLTGLLTRKAFIAVIEKKLAALGATPQGAVVGLLRLENIRQVNDARGTDAGDTALKDAATELTSRYKKKPVTLGRLGGGELGLFWERGGQAAVQQDMLGALDELNARELSAAGTALALRWTAGLVEVQDGLARPEQLLTAAAEVAIKTPEDRPVAIASREQRQPEQLKQVIDYVPKAVARDRLVLLLQEARTTDKPQPPIAEMVVSAEDRKAKLIPPGLFGQAVGSSKQGWDIDLWTARCTLRWILEHPAASDRFGLLIVPLSRAALMREGLAATLLDLLMEFSVAPARLCFSLADRDAVAYLAETADLVNTLKSFGCRFMLDEFGGGQGDYAHVRELAVDYVCLQRDVIDEARHNPKDYAMAKSINELAHFMGKLTLVRQSSAEAPDGWARELGVDLILDQTRLRRLNTQPA